MEMIKAGRRQFSWGSWQLESCWLGRGVSAGTPKEFTGIR